MATRNLTMIIPLDRYNKGYNYPANYKKYSCVNMYLHHDGYPEWQGVQLANWLKANAFQDETKLAAKLVHDHYYDSCYLYKDPDKIDHQYTYVIWSGKQDRWISCYCNYTSRNIFVLKPEKIISKYMDDMDYTDFANGETRWNENIESKKVDLSLKDYNGIRVNAQKIIDILLNTN